jgi:hypothetical protein
MAVRRLLILLATISLGLAGLVVVAGPAAADGVMTPSTTSVAVGGSLSVDVTGCSLDVEEGSLIRFQSPRVTMVTGVGGAERALNLSGPGSSVAIPGWVDPEAPAELRGVCIETTYDYELGVEATSEVFRYAPVAIDVIPAEAPEARQISLSLGGSV